MSNEDRAKATAKNIEGKAQEAMGNITGNTEDQAKGKIGRAHVWTPVTVPYLVCRLLLEKKKTLPFHSQKF